jgi:hypothetical protein
VIHISTDSVLAEAVFELAAASHGGPDQGGVECLNHTIQQLAGSERFHSGDRPSEIVTQTTRTSHDLIDRTTGAPGV